MGPTAPGSLARSRNKLREPVEAHAHVATLPQRRSGITGSATPTRHISPRYTGTLAATVPRPCARGWLPLWSRCQSSPPRNRRASSCRPSKLRSAPARPSMGARSERAPSSASACTGHRSTANPRRDSASDSSRRRASTFNRQPSMTHPSRRSCATLALRQHARRRAQQALRRARACRDTLVLPSTKYRLRRLAPPAGDPTAARDLRRERDAVDQMIDETSRRVLFVETSVPDAIWIHDGVRSVEARTEATARRHEHAARAAREQLALHRREKPVLPRCRTRVSRSRRTFVHTNRCSSSEIVGECERRVNATSLSVLLPTSKKVRETLSAKASFGHHAHPGRKRVTPQHHIIKETSRDACLVFSRTSSSATATSACTSSSRRRSPTRSKASCPRSRVYLYQMSIDPEGYDCDAALRARRGSARRRHDQGVLPPSPPLGPPRLPDVGVGADAGGRAAAARPHHPHGHGEPRDSTREQLKGQSFEDDFKLNILMSRAPRRRHARAVLGQLESAGASGRAGVDRDPDPPGEARGVQARPDAPARVQVHHRPDASRSTGPSGNPFLGAKRLDLGGGATDGKK